MTSAKYCDRVVDPDQLNNVAGQLSASRLAALHDALGKLRNSQPRRLLTAGHVTA